MQGGMFGIGAIELMLMMLLTGGAGTPTSVPPLPEDPLLAKVAPAECVVYMMWAGNGIPNGSSTNHTEQLLAEPQVQKFLKEADQRMQQMFKNPNGPGGGGPPAEMMGALNAILARPGVFFISDIRAQQGGQPDVKGGLVLNLGDKAAEIKAQFEKLESSGMLEVQTVEIGKTTFRRFTIPGSTSQLTWGLRGKYLLTGIGEGSVEGIMQRAAGDAPAWLKEVRTNLPVPRVSSIAYVNLPKVIQTAVAASGSPQGEKIVKAFGLDNAKTFATVSGLDETGFVSRAEVTLQGTPSGIFSWINMQPLTAADLKSIPGDSPVAGLMKLNIGNAVDSWLAMAGEVEPRAAAEMNQGIQQFEMMTGIKLREEVFNSLGDKWRLYADSDNGGLIGGWTIGVSLKDKAKFSQAHDRLLVLMKQAGQRPGSPQVDETKIAGQKAYVLTLPGPVPVTPSWCLTDNELLIGITTNALEAAVTNKTVNPSLADEKNVASLLAGKNGLLALLHVDSRQVFSTLYPMVPALLQGMGGPGGFGPGGQGGGGPAFDPAALPKVEVIAKHLQPGTMALQRTPRGIEFYSQQTLPGGNIGASGPTAVALLLPGVQGARGAARRAQTSNNLRQIGLAMHNMHDTYRWFPAAYKADKNDKPLLSWRVYALPYIDQAPLFQQFHLDEPWDSDHNKQLIERMPQVYRSPNSKAEAGKTNYLGVRGEAGIFAKPTDSPAGQTPPKGLGMAAITDGTSNTIMVVEANDENAVIWTKPDDFEPQDDPTQGLLGLVPNGFQVLFCDGSARFISANIDKNMLKALFTRNGGEVINFGNF